MPKYLKPTIRLGAAGTAMLLLSIKTAASPTLFLPGLICAALAAILLFMTIGSAAAGKKGKKISGWKLFAFSDLGLMLVLGTLGAIELFISEDSASFGPGMLGAILLEYCLPVLGGLLILEFLLYKTVKMYQTEEPKQEPAPAQEKQLPPRISYPAETKDKE